MSKTGMDVQRSMQLVDDENAMRTGIWRKGLPPEEDILESLARDHEDVPQLISTQLSTKKILNNIPKVWLDVPFRSTRRLCSKIV